MSIDRRRFLRAGAATAALAVLGARSLFAQEWAAPTGVTRASRPLKFLFLGGTRFIGPHQVQAALARGHEVTLFNRGRTNSDWFPDVEKLRGDRDGDLGALLDRRWDVVIDNSAHIPRWIRDVGRRLQEKVSHYVFTSSTGVYHPYTATGLDETAEVRAIEDPETEVVNGETFGPLKVACEREAERWWPGRTTIVRPHLIVGPGDNSDRFTYWPVRLARGGEVLAPGDPSDPVQWIDVRDLAAFYVRVAEEKAYGIYNLAGPAEPATIGSMLEVGRSCFDVASELTWVDAEFLEEHDVQGWSHLPVWIRPTGEYLGMNQIDGSKARRAGLLHRPLTETMRDTYAWWQQRPDEEKAAPRAGLSAEREREVLAAWHARAH